MYTLIITKVPFEYACFAQALQHLISSSIAHNRAMTPDSNGTLIAKNIAHAIHVRIIISIKNNSLEEIPSSKQKVLRTTGE